MNIQDYLRKINRESQAIFTETLESACDLGKLHYFSTCIFEFSENISDIHEKKVLATVSAQLELSAISASLGMYRSALSSLRLAFEMALGVVYFSIYRLEFQEWIDGRADIKWVSIIDESNGVLSKRFAKAFFDDLSDDILNYRAKAISVYRKLSEFVHGNRETWNKSGLNIKYDSNLLSFYFDSVSVVFEVVLFSLCCRYLKDFPDDKIESLEFINEEFHHIHAIRSLFGGVKDK